LKKRPIIICALLNVVLLGVVCAGLYLGFLDFFAPLWLLALLGVPVLFGLSIRSLSGLPPATAATSLMVRCVLWWLLTCCLADVQRVQSADNLCVIYVLDQSASIPEEVAAQQLDYVNASVKTKERDDTAGLVICGESSSVEIMPGPDLYADRIYSHVGKQHTDLQAALELATAAFPADTRKKIVLLTDGNENKGDLLEGVAFATGNKVALDILPVAYQYADEVLVDKIYLPDKVRENETFDVKAIVQASRAGPAQLSMFRNGVAIARRDVTLKKGRNTFVSAMKVDEPGFYAYSARISSEHDTIAPNNEAMGHVYIQGESRILIVAPTDQEVAPLMQACREEDIDADLIGPNDLPDSLAMLQNYDCIVLANVAADYMRESQMEMLRANVRDLGVGLVMIGGENSFGAGDYDDTPIEEALPVSMDIKQKKINPKGALVIVLHTCEFANGNYWAKEITKRAIETVNRQDDVGVLLYGAGKEEWLFELRPAADKAFIYSRIDQASPGDMPSFDPTIQLAYDGLKASDAMVKHMIIISDGDPASPTPELVAKIKEIGVTMSTVAINPHSPRDLSIMKYLAYQTGGRYYLAHDPSALPQIFTKEAKVVKRSLIFNEPFTPRLVLSTELTKGLQQDNIPPLLAYVATTPKPRALVPLVSSNENEDPIFAYWRYGLGKSVAFTSDATSNWAKHWVVWDAYTSFWGQTLRWASRKREQSNIRLRTEISAGRGKLIVDAVDQRGAFINFLELNGRIVDPANKGEPLAIRQTAPGRYEADFDASKVGVSILNVGYKNPLTGGQGFSATGVATPYSDEFRTLSSRWPLLQRAAEAAGGRILSGDADADAVYNSELPPSVSMRPIWEQLMLLSIIVFLVDVVIRRVVITRQDLHDLYRNTRHVFSRRGPVGEQDETMRSLLDRKARTFSRKPDAAPRPTEAFRDKLAQQAGSVSPIDSIPLENASTSSRPVKSSEKKQTSSPLEIESDSYTDRLLAAKRRAREKGKENEH
jgi:uncharacterized membrane protein/Mg-chelatase subunit ChlD